MKKHPIIDCHAHIMSEDMMTRLRREAPAIGPELTDITKEDATLRVGHIVQKPFPRGGWDMERRLADMDKAGVDIQVVSVLPHTFLYDLDAKLALTLAQIQNEAIAEICKQVPGRLLGLAQIPMQAPELAAAELERAMTKLGHRGFMICSHIEGRNLDDPSLEPVWAKAAALGAFILVHPQKVAAGDRLGSYYLKNLIGNPLETTIAAASLVFGGVLERHPKLKFMLSHGGGFAPYQYGRFRHGWDVRPEARKNLPNGPGASLDRLYYDTILHAGPQLEFLISQQGADHIVLGSDYPFDMGMMDCARFVQGLKISDADRQRILSDGPALLLSGI
jgi:aminocarboxymuconate-semialdehyde decarboxylase